MSLLLPVGISSVVSFVAGKVGGKFLDNLLDKAMNRNRIAFYDASVVYCYSHYDDQGNHVKEGRGTKMIYQVRCGVVLHNASKFPAILRDIKVIAIVNGERIQMNLWDEELEKWNDIYTIPPQHLQRLSWNAVVPGLGLRNSMDGMIRVKGEGEPITFEISYLNSRVNRRSIHATVSQVRMLDPDRLVNN